MLGIFDTDFLMRECCCGFIIPSGSEHLGPDGSDVLMPSLSDLRQKTDRLQDRIVRLAAREFLEDGSEF